MKTLCLTLGLLLLIACYCNAMPEALQNAVPGKCCFDFSDRARHIRTVKTVTKTHSSCEEKAFIVQTKRGNQICYKESSQWAQFAYKKLQNTEGSGM